ncbi:MAG TPA: Gfo/Idh/MocA family oxidoreductase [Mycobacteriales bacterium]|nr:Gfo/Idh/MocA family oxidoreductase [Mycobacteriales bacterium]
MSSLKVAVVGNGGISSRHSEGYRDTGLTTLVGVADIIPERAQAFGEKYGTENRYTSVTDLLAEQSPDLVSICTPPGTHAEIAIEVLRAGHSVLMEKPPCISLAEFDAIAEAEAASAGNAYVVFQHRHGSGAQRARRLIADGSLGRPQVALCETMWFRADSYFDLDWRGTWVGEGGGPTLGHGIHQIDLLMHLFGDWTSITAIAARVARPVEFEDVSMAAVAFANGAVASLVNSLLSPREESRLRFDFTGGTLEVEHLYGYSDSDWHFTPAPDKKKAATFGRDPGVAKPGPSAPEPTGLDPWTESAGEDVRSNHAAQINTLVADLAAGKQSQNRLADTRATVEIVTALYASSLTGRTVRRDELTPDNPFYAHLAGDLSLDEISRRMDPQHLGA